MSSLDFFVLGSGCFTPGKPGRKNVVRNPAGYAIRHGREVVLFDFGFGNFRQMVRAGLDPEEVSHVFLSHRHPDHIGDLPALLFYYRYDGKPRGGKLHLYGPRGFRNFFKHLTRAHHPWMRPRGFQIKVEEVEEGQTVKGAGWKVQCREVPHTTESLAFRFESKEGSVCYSGDTAYDPGIAQFASDVSLFAVECTLEDKERSNGHLRVSEALDLAKRSNARRVLFTHLSEASKRALLRRLPSGRRMKPAEDLMRVQIAS